MGPALVRILVGRAESGRPAVEPGVEKGLGFLVDRRGYVVTHAEVVGDATAYDVALADGRKLPVKRVWRDRLTGVAVLKIEGSGLAALPLGESGGLRVGDATVIVGGPSPAQITPLRATIRATGSATGGNLAIDVPISTWFGGSPVIDSRGQVVGIAATDVHSAEGSSRGGFAIPIDRAKSILRQAQSTASQSQPTAPSFR
jgi:serine protease Do